MAQQEAATAFGGDIGEQRFAALWDRHRRNVAYVGVALAVIGVGAWFYERSKSLKEEHAQAAYEAALVSVASGNLPLAESDLRKLVTRYSGTNAAAEGAMALAKLDYQRGKYQDGVRFLEGVNSYGGPLRFDIRVLEGVGYEGAGNWAAAAHVYQQAADAARFDADRAQAQAMAARALQAGGNPQAAARIWQKLADDPKSGYQGEAKIRLGELQARPMKV